MGNNEGGGGVPGGRGTSEGDRGGISINEVLSGGGRHLSWNKIPSAGINLRLLSCRRPNNTVDGSLCCMGSSHFQQVAILWGMSGSGERDSRARQRERDRDTHTLLYNNLKTCLTVDWCVCLSVSHTHTPRPL
jgi:hypothetical protein